MEKYFTIIAIKPYQDLLLHKEITVGEITVLKDKERAYAICNAGLAQIYSIIKH
jgi:hypothetical protein